MLTFSHEVAEIIKFLHIAITKTPFENNIFLTGGVIRNTLFNKDINDIDIIVTLEDGAKSFVDFLQKNYSRVFASSPILLSKSNAYHLSLYIQNYEQSIELECKTAELSYDKQFNLDYDALSRDFTINSLYYNVTKYELIDVCGGLEDVNSKMIRTIQDASVTFQHSPIRMLRAIRLAVSCNCQIDKATWIGIILNAHRIKNEPIEKINKEIQLILTSNRPSVGLYRLHNSGLLQYVLKDIDELATTAYDGENSILDHTFQVIDKTQNDIVHRLSALFHDISKSLGTYCYKQDSDEISADIAYSDLKELKLPNCTIKAVRRTIEKIHTFDKFKNDIFPSDHFLKKFINDCGNELLPVLDLIFANMYSKGESMEKFKLIVQKIEDIIDKKEKEKVILPINGNDILKKYKKKPGLWIGDALSLIKDKQIDNPSLTQEDCWKLIDKFVLEFKE